MIFFLLSAQNNKVVSFHRIKDLPDQFTACQKVAFSSDSQTIHLAKSNLSVDVFRLLISEEAVDIDFESTFDLSKSLKGPIAHFILSNCGQYLVVADNFCNITVWRQNKRNWSHHINLPKYHVSAVSIAVHKHSPKLIAAFADGKIFEYHLEEMKFLCATTTLFVEDQDRFAIKNIAPDPKNENIFTVHNDTHLFVLKKQLVGFLFFLLILFFILRMNNPFFFLFQSHQKNDTNDSKRPKSTDDDEENIASLVCTSRFNYEHLLNITWLNDTELVAVGINPITMIAQLPSSLKEKRFGVS